MRFLTVPHLTPGGFRLAGLVALLLVFQALVRPTTGVAPGPAPGPVQAAASTELAAPLDPREPLPAASRQWVDDTLAAMSLEEKAGQVMMVRAFGEYYAADAPQRTDLVEQVRDLALGGVIIFRSEAYEAAALVADLQAEAAAAGNLPLLVAADFEWGAEFRVRGAVPFPTAMAVGATGDPALAEWMGRASARDARALGVHWIFAPVADVNVNPRNPVINVRSFGERPEDVAAMAAAFVRGAQAEGALATAKHFPGHGDTAVDSHIDVPVLRVDAERLQSVELAPFRATIDAGVASVMTAHLSVPSVTASETLPATLSRAVLTDLLRTQLGFRGLVVTDAMEMGGINRHWWSGQAAVKALAAGADMVLLPPFPRAVRAAIVRGVEEGELPAARLDDAVRQVLDAKARLGLHEGRDPGALGDLPGRFAPVADAEWAREAAERAVTLLRDRGEVLPLDPRSPPRVLLVGVSDSNEAIDVGPLATALRRHLGGGVVVRGIDGRTTGEEAAELLAEATRSDVIVLPVRVRVRSNQERIRLPDTQGRYAALIARTETPMVMVALGSPYAVAAFPDAGAAVATYGWSLPLQEALASAMVGRTAWQGHLPVTVPELYPLGYGVERPALDTTLRTGAAAGGEDAGESRAGAFPAAAGAPSAVSTAGLDRTPLTAADLEPARAALEGFVASRAFPGAVYAVGHRNVLVAVDAVGRMSYDADAPAMPVDAVFDLASVTKVVATTTVAMRAFQEGRLRLDHPVQSYVPEFRGPGKDEVTVRHLLTHTSGLPPFERYYLDHDPASAGPAVAADIRRRIHETALEAPAGQRTAYSDLGLILLGEVLERALGEPFDEVARREVFAPLGMDETLWTPPAEWRPRVPPTEDDPWRGGVVRGEVHDENAAIMGGVSTHAGLFSTARDLATFAQMLLNGGTYGHRRLLLPSTVQSWTRRQNVTADSSRALGWDTARPGGAWSMFSDSAYGHTGFTGTSIWIDPERRLFVVLLTNRVHPTRDNDQIRDARVAFHRAVVDAVDAAARRDPDGPGE